MDHPGEEGSPENLRDAARRSLDLALAARDRLPVAQRAYVSALLSAEAAVTYAIQDVAAELREANRIARKRR